MNEDKDLAEFYNSDPLLEQRLLLLNEEGFLVFKHALNTPLPANNQVLIQKLFAKKAPWEN